MNSYSARRRHPMATAVVLLLALVTMGAVYTLLAPGGKAEAAAGDPGGSAERGKALFLANCSSCHGLNAEGSSDGPTLVGVGAASVDFQVGTGRMPAALSEAAQIPQLAKTVFSQPEIDDLAAYVASLAPGPEIPTGELYETQGLPADEIAEGGEIYRTNCAMCHNVNASGGALTQGKYAPALHGVDGKYIYEAMLTGPQSMPVFGESLPEDSKRKIIAYLNQIDEQPDYGGLSLLKVGPLSEGAIAWIVGTGALIGVAVWLGAKSA